SGGVASFSGINIDNIGAGYTLSASASGLTGATSNALNVVAPPGVNAWINNTGIPAPNWGTASNWSKGTVPVATDTVAIAQSGNYIVNLDVNGTFASFGLGAPLGSQTLSIAANTLTLGGNGGVTATGHLQLSGGSITGSG